MPDPNTLMKAGTLFPTELVPELFNTVRGHSALAKLSGMKPIPFTGTEEFIFSMDGEASLVAEGGAKPAGDANLTPKVIKPLKFVYQHRMTDEFKRCSNLKRVQYLEAFAEGGSVKMARALDIAAIHGVIPATGSNASFRATNSFDGVLSSPVLLNTDEEADETLEGAIAALKATERDVTGVIFAPAFAGNLAALVNNAGQYKYPEFRFGANPGSFGGSSSFVQKRAVGKRHGGEVAHGSLEVQQSFQASLRNFGLIRSVRCIPYRILEYVALDNSRADGIVPTHTYIRCIKLVLRSQVGNMFGKLAFSHRSFQCQRFLQADVGRDSLVYQLVYTAYTNFLEHDGKIGFLNTIMSFGQ